MTFLCLENQAGKDKSIPVFLFHTQHPDKLPEVDVAIVIKVGQPEHILMSEHILLSLCLSQVSVCNFLVFMQKYCLYFQLFWSLCLSMGCICYGFGLYAWSMSLFAMGYGFLSLNMFSLFNCLQPSCLISDHVTWFWAPPVST